MAAPVSIPYASLLTPSPALTSLLRAAFSSSPTSLGLLLITDVPPSFPALRLRLLLIANEFASLDESTRQRYEDPGSSYSFGWSWGKELMNGKRDTMKGSYYANPLSAALKVEGGRGKGQERNIWPDEDCEGFKAAFDELCGVMLEVSERVARACDGFMSEEGVGQNGKGVEHLLRESWGHKARLLHYFPPEGQVLGLPSTTDDRPFTSSVSSIDDSWCGTHIDHSLLTALCPSMYLFHPTTADGTLVPSLQPLIIPCPSPSTGLYVKTRGGEIIKAVIPENAIAFQTGETLSLLSNETLCATPHFVHLDQTASVLSEHAAKVVRAKIAEDASWKDVVGGKVSRETLAVFLQPNDEEVIGNDGETFGAFTQRVLTRHY